MQASWCEFGVRFVINDRTVSMTSRFDHAPEEGSVDPGWCYGLALLEVAGRLRDHLSPVEWGSFVKAISQLANPAQ
jgi:hypothetical protein